MLKFWIHYCKSVPRVYMNLSTLNTDTINYNVHYIIIKHVHIHVIVIVLKNALCKIKFQKVSSDCIL